MRKGVFFLLTFTFLFSCGEEKPVSFRPPPPPPPSPLEKKISGGGPQERPVIPSVDYSKLDECTKHLLFADQFITASDYPEAEEEISKASEFCSPDDPKFLYMKALLLDIEEKREEAYRLYYKAAKGFIKKGDLEGAFKCYSGMLSINPFGKEVKELKPYFQDDDY